MKHKFEQSSSFEFEEIMFSSLYGYSFTVNSNELKSDLKLSLVNEFIFSILNDDLDSAARIVNELNSKQKEDLVHLKISCTTENPFFLPFEVPPAICPLIYSMLKKQNAQITEARIQWSSPKELAKALKRDNVARFIDIIQFTQEASTIALGKIESSNLELLPHEMIQYILFIASPDQITKENIFKFISSCFSVKDNTMPEEKTLFEPDHNAQEKESVLITGQSFFPLNNIPSNTDSATSDSSEINEMDTDSYSYPR